MDGGSRNFAKSAARALDVMEYLAAEDGPRRAVEIADALGMARSSADQLLKTMQTSGYLAVVPPGKSYCPTMRLAHFGRWLTGRYPEIEMWRSIQAEIHANIGEIVTIASRSECNMQIMGALGRSPEDPALDIGTRIPVVGSALGGAAMMSRSKHELRRVYELACRRRVIMQGVTLDMPFVEEVPLFRMRGYSRRALRMQLGQGAGKDYWSIAMKLPSACGADAIIGLSGPAGRVRPREWEFVNMMRRTIQAHAPRAH